MPALSLTYSPARQVTELGGFPRDLDGLLALLNAVDADASVGDFYQATINALVEVNDSIHFQDDLTLLLLKQQPPESRLHARALSRMRKMMMRWMKRKETTCATALPELPPPVNV